MLAPPLFIKLKVAVTVSPGSITPLGGAQPSVTSVVPSATMTGVPCKQTGTFVLLPLVILKFPDTVP